MLNVWLLSSYVVSYWILLWLFNSSFFFLESCLWIWLWNKLCLDFNRMIYFKKQNFPKLISIKKLFIKVFTVTICFSVVCPFITPFGLIYLLLKHLTDRYNIYFAYIFTKCDKTIHRNAVSFTISSLIMLQLSILFFIAIKDR